MGKAKLDITDGRRLSDPSDIDRGRISLFAF
jgi:hypothetical protein